MKKSLKKHTVTLTSTDTFPTSSLAPSSSLLDGTPAILNEIKTKNPTFDINESIKKSNEIYTTFCENMKTYPKFISYEAATLLNVAFAVGNDLLLDKLPVEDQIIVKTQLDSTANKSYINREKFKIEMDESKDFRLLFEIQGTGAKEVVRLFNTVIHPNPADNDGVPLKIGNLNLENKSEAFKHLAGIPKKEDVIQVKEASIKTPSKNAFEIRSDVLNMAIKWASLEDEGRFEKPSDDQLLNLARKFYDFVENKRN